MLKEEGELKEMEKSSGRQSSVPPRPNGSDSKKDGSASNGRRRGNKWRHDNSSSKAKSDSASQRRPNQPQYKPNDKRPRARGAYNEGPKQEVTLREVNSLRQSSSHNYLLNFSYSSERDRGYSRGSGKPRSKQPKWGAKQSGARYNKEQFLQANCQFVVAEDGDYSVHSVDPDTLVEWSFIEQVRSFGQGIPSCPICLYPPIAAKITRCGHIYCWACILNYLSRSEKHWAKCPICFESIHEQNLKSVKTLDAHGVSIGDSIKMTLMKRSRNSTYAQPVYNWKEDRTKPHNIADKDASLSFCKLLTADTDQIMEIIAEEKRQLTIQLQEEGQGSLERSYVQAALTALAKREKIVEQKRKTSVAKVMDSLEKLSASTNSPTEEKKIAQPVAKSKKTYSSAFSDEEEEEEQQGMQEENAGEDRTDSPDSLDSSGQSTPKLSVNGEQAEVPLPTQGLTVDEAVEDLALPPPLGQEEEEGGKKKPNAITNTYYFYQASSGHHVYMHSLNARALVKEYGSLENSPPEIEATVRDVEGISMSEDLRPRLRYLSHLPVTCEFQVVELQLKPPLVSKATVAAFKDEVAKRQRQRQRKERDENRKLKKAQEEENRKMEQCPEMRAYLGVLQNHGIPELQSVIIPSEAPNLQANLSQSPVSPQIFTPDGSPPLDDHDVNGGQTSLSFAQMLRAGKAKPTEPVVSASSGATVKTPVWPAPRASRSSESDVDKDNEDYVPVPQYQDTLRNAIEEALNKATTAKQTEDETSSAGGNGGGKKKKKKVKQLLFSTSMQRPT